HDTYTASHTLYTLTVSHSLTGSHTQSQTHAVQTHTHSLKHTHTQSHTHTRSLTHSLEHTHAVSNTREARHPGPSEPRELGPNIPTLHLQQQQPLRLAPRVTTAVIGTGKVAPAETEGGGTAGRDGPRDRFKAVWIIFFLLGLGTLLPWNFFITAEEYFKSRLAQRHVSSNASGQPGVQGNASEVGGHHPADSSLERNFNSVLTLCSMLPMLIFTCLNSVLHRRISECVRMLGSLVAILIFFVLTAALVHVHVLSHQPSTFFAITMVTAFLINSFVAVLQGSIFGLVGLLPLNYAVPVMSGQGMAGIFAALAMIFSLLQGNDHSHSAFGYFITACVTIFITIIAYLAMSKLKFATFYFSKRGRGHEAEEPEGYSVPEGNKRPDGEGPELELDAKPEPKIMEPDSVLSILKQIWIPALCVCLTFTITLGVYPAITADVVSTSATPGSRWEILFIPISCFLLFNLLDWAGRSFAGVVTFPSIGSLWLLLLLVCTRAAFVPLFMMCNAHPRGAAALPVLFPHDAVFIVLILLFAFSNGYLATVAMCYGPKKVSSHNAETAGAIMAFFLSLGLSLGASISFLFRSLV
ncbi:equilibrative nucleoside transporter 1-like, partial [Lethenteron reissneri]|uniref:equilibrative nucleoside transporter 1-like n=1 Tax=Lethenteron reissneri TaxID=7753 RepID=UPI002AB70F9B